MSRQQAKDSRITVDAIYDDMNASMPVGAIVAFGGSVAPAGWHLCDGTAHGSAALQAAIGSANTPDLRARFIVGAGPGQGNDSQGNPLSNRAVGAKSGAESVKLTAAQSGVPAHGHGITDPGHGHTIPEGVTSGQATVTGIHQSSWGWYTTNRGSWLGVINNTTGITVNNNAAADAASAHENLPPFYALTYIIRKERL